MKRVLTFLMNGIRPLLGPRITCIYPVTCRCYATALLETLPYWKSIPLIALRVLSCNPLTVLWWKLRARIRKSL